MLLGAHVSIGGGYENALVEAERLRMDAIQIFTKNQRFWREREVGEDEGKSFRKTMKSLGVKQAFSHAIYLISMGSQNDEIVEKSINSLAMELRRCDTLGLTHTVMHPGHSGALTTSQGILKIGDNIKKAIRLSGVKKVKLLLENTAGAGTSVGGRIEHLAELLDHLNSKQVGVCIDTCHAFAAGYDIRTNKGIATFLDLVMKHTGEDKLLCFHLNDSKGKLGSRLDRHAHIGHGELGTVPFRYIMQNFPHLPKVLETSKENNADAENLRVLRSFLKE